MKNQSNWQPYPLSSLEVRLISPNKKALFNKFISLHAELLNMLFEVRQSNKTNLTKATTGRIANLPAIETTKNNQINLYYMGVKYPVFFVRESYNKILKPEWPRVYAECLKKLLNMNRSRTQSTTLAHVVRIVKSKIDRLPKAWVGEIKPEEHIYVTKIMRHLRKAINKVLDENKINIKVFIGSKREDYLLNAERYRKSMNSSNS
ncbi:MAG: hypothetical protein LHV68_08700 [Elusimicrobia bacterium]|nr:hypothetical protein [Candidatus Liberimonas magnetica]